MITWQALKGKITHKYSQYHLSSQIRRHCEDSYSIFRHFHIARIRREGGGGGETWQEVGLAHWPSVQVAAHRPPQTHAPHPAAQRPLLHTTMALSALAVCNRSYDWPLLGMAAIH